MDTTLKMFSEEEAEDEAAVEVMELFISFDGSSRDHYANQHSPHFAIDLCGQRIDISQDGSLQMGLGVTGGRVWDASVVLAKLVEHSGVSRMGLSPSTLCLELGAGCGLAGMATALLGAPTVLTEQSMMLPHLERNLAANDVAAHVSGGRLAAVELQWGEPLATVDFPPWVGEWECPTIATPGSDSAAASLSPSSSVPPSFDLVLCADLAYNENVVVELLDALKRVTGPDTLVLFSMELRTPPVLQGLLSALLAEGFVVARVPRCGDVESDNDSGGDGRTAAAATASAGGAGSFFFHPDYSSPSVIIYALRRGPRAEAMAQAAGGGELPGKDALHDERGEEGDGAGIRARVSPQMCPFFAGLMQLTSSAPAGEGGG